VALHITYTKIKLLVNQAKAMRSTLGTQSQFLANCPLPLLFSSLIVWRIILANRLKEEPRKDKESHSRRIH